MVTADKFKKEPTDAQKALVGSLEPPPVDGIEAYEDLRLATLKNLIQKYPKEAKQFLEELGK